MDPMSFWIALLQLLVTPIAAAAAIAWVGKGFFSQLLARDLAHYKHREQRDTEQHKKVLESIQFEQQTRFTWAHQKQADAIAAIYGKLAAAHRNITVMVHPMQFGEADKELKRKEATEAYMALDDYFTVNRIFLKEESGIAVEALITAIRMSFNQFAMASSGANSTDLKAWVEASNRMEKETPTLLVELRKEFRTALHIAE